MLLYTTNPLSGHPFVSISFDSTHNVVEIAASPGGDALHEQQAKTFLEHLQTLRRDRDIKQLPDGHPRTTAKTNPVACWYDPEIDRFRISTAKDRVLLDTPRLTATIDTLSDLVDSPKSQPTLTDA